MGRRLLPLAGFLVLITGRRGVLALLSPVLRVLLSLALLVLLVLLVLLFPVLLLLLLVLLVPALSPALLFVLLFLIVGRPERPLQILARFAVLGIQSDGLPVSGRRFPKRAGAEEGVRQVVESVAPDLSVRAAPERRLIAAQRFGKRALFAGDRTTLRLSQAVVDPGDVEIVLGGVRKGALGLRKGPQRLLQPARFEVFRSFPGVLFAAAEQLHGHQQHERGADHETPP